MRKLFISLCFSACCSLLAAQTTNPIQEAMANYDYETALMLIDQETPTVPLLYQKGKALKGLGNNLEALSVFQEVVAQDSLNPGHTLKLPNAANHLPNIARHWITTKMRST